MKSTWVAAFFATVFSGAGCVDAGAARDAYVFPEPDATVIDATAADADVVEPDGDAAADGEDGDAAGPILSPESASLATVWSGEAAWVAPISSGATLVAAADGPWWWIDGAGARAVVGEDELTVPTETPTALAVLNGGTALVAVGAAIYRLSDGVLGETPLSDALGGAAVTDLATPDGAGLWIATESALWRWRDDALTAVSLDALPVAGADLACGAPVDGRDAVWVAAGGQVYAVSSGDAGFDLWPERPELDAAALGVDDGGRLWVVGVDGAVTRRTPDAIWREVALPEAIVSIAARRDSPHVWLRGSSGRLFHAVGDSLSEVTNAPVGELATPPSADGAALLASADGVVQVAPGRVVAILGTRPGDALSEPTTLTIRASQPDEVESVSISLDETEIAATAVDEVWQLVLDPPSLANGDHRVDVEVSWSDATLTTALRFRVAFPTWSEGIEPLYEKRCAACHDAVTGAATVVLDEMSAWTSRIDCIICRVSTPFDPNAPECMVCQGAPSSMPPTGPLPDPEIDLVRQWRVGGLRP